MRIFLTGSTGYLGSVLIQHLAGLPDVECITGVDVAPPRHALPPKVQFVKMDVRSAGIANAMAGHDTVIHTGFVVRWTANMPAAVRDDINLNGVRNVAGAAATHKVRRVIHASSTAAYDPRGIVGKTGLTEDFPTGQGLASFYYTNGKAVAERTFAEILGAAGVPLTLLRPVPITGPSDQSLLLLLGDMRAKLWRRNPRLQACHEDDVAGAFVQAIRTDMNGAYNVAPDDFIRDQDVWRILNWRFVPTLPWTVLAVLVGIRWRYFGSTTHPYWLRARMADFTVSNAKLKGTGWKPMYGTAEALRSALKAALS